MGTLKGIYKKINKYIQILDATANPSYNATMKRILLHPVLGEMAHKPGVTIYFEGRPIEALEGEPIAAALEAAGISDFRYSHRFNEPRGLYCGIGQCQECVMVVDGVPNIRTCVTPVKEGMRVERQHGRGRMVADEHE